MKIIVNLFTDNSDHTSTMEASHANNRDFARDWTNAKRAAQDEHPDDWQVSDIEHILKRWGWKLKKITAVEVIY